LTKKKKSVILSSMKTKYITLILFLFLVFFCYIITFPDTYNRKVRILNEKTPFSLPLLEERDFVFGLDLQGGAYLLYQADFEGVPSGERIQRMEGLRNLIERRVNLYGIAESSVQVRGERLVVEIPGAHDLDRAIDIIGETPFLDFREISPEIEKMQEEKIEEIASYLGKEVEEISFEDILGLDESEIENWEIIFDEPYKETNLTGRHLENARVSMHPVTQEPVILLTFNKEGAVLFEEITERNVGKPVATFLDGVLLQEATVQEKISGGEAQITGGFSMEEAYNVARDLRIGALPVPIELISQQSIGPALGEDSLAVSLRAGMLGMLFVAAFMIFVYRLPGLLAVISLSTYVLFVIFLFKVIPITLTLSGIAGFILSIGMAIDANILIISRLREEIRDGKSVFKSVDEGYKRAWSSIRDGNITTLMVAIILFFITTSFVRGFAVTLILGILVSLFCAMIINRLFLTFFEEGRFSKIKDLWV
jgi:preprotein translocase subunit SecD